MAKDEVRNLCGEPTAIEKDGAVWVYDRHPNELLKVVKFVRGEVEFIDERKRPVNP
jgi:hypothetical protein